MEYLTVHNGSRLIHEIATFKIFFLLHPNIENMNSDIVFELRGCILTIWNDATKQDMTTRMNKNRLNMRLLNRKEDITASGLMV
jgi:hypothetical protein